MTVFGPRLWEVRVLMDTQEYYILCKEVGDHQVYVPAEIHRKKSEIPVECEMI